MSDEAARFFFPPTLDDGPCLFARHDGHSAIKHLRARSVETGFADVVLQFNAIKMPQMNVSWIRDSMQASQPQIRLFCIPHAGGGVSIFRTWADSLPAGVQLCSIQLPGREDRMADKPYDRWQALVWALADVLAPHLKDLPFVFFGHSMGALVSFELARELRRRGMKGPECLYVAGHRAPQLPKTDPPVHHLPDAEFVDELRRLEGTPRQVLEHEEMMQLLLPTLRADFTVCETYVYTNDPPLECPIVAIGGIKDSEVSRQELEAWRDQTGQDFTLWMLYGGHFFIHGAQGQLLKRLVADLARFLP